MGKENISPEAPKLHQELSELEADMSNKRSKYNEGRREDWIMQDAIDMNETLELVKNTPPELEKLNLNDQTIEGDIRGHKIKIKREYGYREVPDSFVGEIDGEFIPPSKAQEIFFKFFRPLYLLKEYSYPATKKKMGANEDFSKKRKELMAKIDEINAKIKDILE